LTTPPFNFSAFGNSIASLLLSTIFRVHVCKDINHTSIYTFHKSLENNFTLAKLLPSDNKKPCHIAMDRAGRFMVHFPVGEDMGAFLKAITLLMLDSTPISGKVNVYSISFS
jgi:hypothetical protein